MFYDIQCKRKIDRFREKETLTIRDYNIYNMRNRYSKRERERERGERDRYIDKHRL